jgi:hypothetical protein
MSLRSFGLIVVAFMAALTLSPAPAGAQNSPAAQRIFDRARAATGGSGWNQIRGLHEVGEENGVAVERWFDPLRYGARIERHTAQGKLVNGYNGAAEWRILAGGVQTGSLERPIVAKARAEAFFGAYAYFFPSRFDLKSVYVGVRENRGRSFDVVRVQPAGGAHRELWFDRANGLLGLMIEQDVEAPETIELSDYRRVGPLRLPHRVVIYGGGRTKPVERTIKRIELEAADRSLFSLPRP